MRPHRSLLNASTPGANRGVAAPVRVKNRQGVRRPRLTVNRHEHAPAARQHIENSPVMRLESDASHGARDTELPQALVASLQRRNQRPSRKDGTQLSYVERLRRAELPLDKGRQLG